MPPTARRGVQIGEGSEPVAQVNPDPPRSPGSGVDVDPHVRVENVAPLVPAIPLEGAVPIGMEQFLVLDTEPDESSSGEFKGWHEPPVVLTGVRHEFEPDGNEYVVLARPWVNVVLADDRFVTGRRGDVIVVSADTARRGLETGTIVPAAEFSSV